MADHSYVEDTGSGRALQTVAQNPPPEGISESDYEAIEDAVMETARGRWFLKEYARRMRASETASLHAALERIERIVTLTHAPRADAQAQLHMRERMEGISERLLDISWYMRERGFSGSICSSIDEEARQLASLTKAFDIGAAAAEDNDTRDAPPEGNDEVEEDRGSNSDDTTCDASASVMETTESWVEVEVIVQEQACEAAPVQTPAQDIKSAPSLASRLAAFVHIDAMPVRQRLALCA